jgi:hypothetical protein
VQLNVTIPILEKDEVHTEKTSEPRKMGAWLEFSKTIRGIKSYPFNIKGFIIGTFPY